MAAPAAWMNRFNDGADFAIVSFFHKNFGQSHLAKLVWEVICLPGDGVLYFPIILPIAIVVWAAGYFPVLTREQEYLICFLYVVLLVDLVLNFLIKGFVKRHRPSFHKHDMRFPGPDKYSFPSGHASRAGTMVAFFAALLQYHDEMLLLATSGAIADVAPSTLLAMAWTWAVVNSIGRLALGRHFASDVILGTALGYFFFFPVAHMIMLAVLPPPLGIPM
ncbi:Aste57867_13603 [Aphanomyces stellatus]|uniref:Aste57867_13603 protein n=1 Tax=Aphanomyces stellatus TaxID=120398 RepID=A0A485KZF4_9STRA|nr:hypothetical protein As57867_013553 [Aphanomyces stellatus]VFT90440.1 Aste57867_13603 [Aphanomyces stellatus]